MKPKRLGNRTTLALAGALKKIGAMEKYVRICEFLTRIDYAVSDRTIRRLIGANKISGFRFQHNSVLYLDTEQVEAYVRSEQEKLGGSREKHSKTV